MERPAKNPIRSVRDRALSGFFIENKDEASRSLARFYSSDRAQRYVFGDGGVSIRMGNTRQSGSALGFTFANYVEPKGKDLIPTRVDVMRLRSSGSSAPKKVRKLEYEQAFAGVDLEFEFSEAQLSQTITVRPSASVSAIDLSYSGVDHLKLLADGSLEVVFAGGNLRYSAPVCFERGLRGSAPIDCAYQMTGLRSFGLSLVGSRDAELALVVQSEIAATEE